MAGRKKIIHCYSSFGFVAWSILALPLISCNKNSPTEISLEKRSDSSYIIHAVTENVKSDWSLPYPVFRFEQGDINNDSLDEILVGVVKATRFDSIVRKRIFIFKLVGGNIRPLWLGSGVSKPLEDFKLAKRETENVLLTVEQEQNGNYLVCEYRWKSFGLEFIRYLYRDIGRTDALEKLK